VLRKGVEVIQAGSNYPKIDLGKFYNEINEEMRLSTSKASSVEFLTTRRFIKSCLENGNKIIDIGAGTGAYSIYFADKGYNVVAIEPVKKNLEVLKEKILYKENISAVMGNALDLSMCISDSFDVVLCLGPLYHLRNFEEQKKCIEESYRVCKNGGKIFFAFISNDMVLVNETLNLNLDFMFGRKCNNNTFKVTGDNFHFMNVDEMNALLLNCGLNYSYRFAAEGLSEVFADKINEMTDLQFSKWLDYHYYSCQKDELIGYSNHIVYVVEK